MNLDYLDADEAFVPLVRGLWRDLAVHDFNALAWIFDDRIVSVSAHSSVAENPMYGRHGDVDTASAVLKFSSGAVATLLCGRRMGWRQETRMEVHGTEGSESTDVAATGSRTHRLDGHEEQGEPFTSAMTRFKESYLNETDEFVRLVLGAESTSPPRQCLAALQVALAAEESVRTGRTVEIA
ncbi:Gfo/Idh/MocA family oxidoreductase [Nesterenkonia sp. NBAIMH1]|uniref:Gfo/Idh/MocA family protein n=1 Tax=Nesterenkonia sp. NBAIMH1 TaxID=2600320 RepID=UPI0011B4A665|nr:Gfo/Idh/MocA family oxidoreductase [Nesterenkonia sp. NBAIMH1]